MIRRGLCTLAAALTLAACSAPPKVRLAAEPEALPQQVGLVNGDTLAAWLARGTVRVFDVRPDVFVYLRGHLTQAQYLNIETLRASDAGTPAQLLPGDWYTSLFERLGLGGDLPVVIYSAGESANIDATFAAYLLAATGYPRVYLLDGGWAKWELEHREVARAYPAITLQPWPSNRRFQPARVSLEELKDLINQSRITLVDARPPEQFRGEAGSQMRRGHIPGAISHWWADDLERIDFGLVWKGEDALRAAYAAQGITPDRDIVLYCNSTTEASHVFFALTYLLRYPRVRIYTGAWTEWAAHPELPISVGP
jgi:thiosulfate/3-mercaptopyruvate sulfurtransferase